MRRSAGPEWIHTVRDQGALVRDYVKWDDQPGSAPAARESILHADWIANTAPMEPVYVNLVRGLQEAELPSVCARRWMPRDSGLRWPLVPTPTNWSVPPRSCVALRAL